jgi:hypothetical protein
MPLCSYLLSLKGATTMVALPAAPISKIHWFYKAFFIVGTPIVYVYSNNNFTVTTTPCLLGRFNRNSDDSYNEFSPKVISVHLSTVTTDD